MVKKKFFFLKNSKDTTMQFKKLWRYDRFDMKTKIIKMLRCLYE